MKDWKIYDNDIIVLVADKPTTSKQFQYSNAFIADLVKSIKVPQDSMRHDKSDLKNNELAQVRFYYFSVCVKALFYYENNSLH